MVMIKFPDVPELFKGMTGFEKRAYAKSMGFELNPVVFREAESSVRYISGKNHWADGSGLSVNKDMHAGKAYENSCDFVMPIVLRMINGGER